MQENEQGPSLEISKEIHEMKYRQEGETFRESCSRIANTLADDPDHFKLVRSALLGMRFLPGGRVQASVGSARKTTAFNCFVMDDIEDSMDGIMRVATEAAQTMRLGGGVGYSFSTIRPRGDRIVSLDSQSSGPVSFMDIFDAVCKTVSSAGNRRGAQMAVLRVDHPDIEEFIRSKTNHDRLTKFNISVGITDEFMRAVENGTDFELRFGEQVYKRVDAKYLFDEIMRATWDWAEPGVLFLDRINEMNNLSYCELISSSNPCGEQPLPPYGACLLGSFNLVKYLTPHRDTYKFDWGLFEEDIRIIVPAMDNIIDVTTYPLTQQKEEAESKRRMGLGITALANAGEALGYSYGSAEFLRFNERVMKLLANIAYQTSASLAKSKGAFPLFDKEQYMEGKFIKRLSTETKDMIAEHGIRNSHLISIAPTGTISLAADNVSSGCEPVFHHSFERTIQTETGAITELVEDYGARVLKVKGKTANECTVEDHLGVLITTTKWVDSAVSKTLNVGENVSWEEFKNIYISAWKGGCKGATTFRAAGKRYGILNIVEEEGGDACYYDTATGKKTCD
jgi:ribonucleoside-diphosphate reductase alpha chain